MVNFEVIAKAVELYVDLFEHDGFGEIRIEVKILRRGQKEVIIHCGKQYRYVVDVNEQSHQQLLRGLQLAQQVMDKPKPIST